jgi:hypothetical protein
MRVRSQAATRRALVAVPALMALVAACGGGGGDDPRAGTARTSVSAPARPAPGAAGAGLGRAAAEAAEEADAGPATAGDAGGGADAGLSAEAAALLDDYGLDPEICEEVDADGATAAVSCDFAPITYDLSRLPDAAALDDRFAGLLASEDATARDWWYADAPDFVVGEMYTRASGGRSSVRWTNEDRLVVGHAWMPGDDAATLEELEAWWSSDGSTAAPAPT